MPIALFKTTDLTFEEACHAIRAGYKVRLPYWAANVYMTEKEGRLVTNFANGQESRYSPLELEYALSNKWRVILEPKVSILANVQEVTLEACPFGLFMTADNVLGMKAAGHNEGWVQAFNVEKGGFFYGDPAIPSINGFSYTEESQRKTLVRPIDYKLLMALLTE